MKKLPTWLVDLLERTGATFAQAFLAIETADQANITQLSALKTAAIAGGFAVGKYLLVKASAYLNPAPPAPFVVSASSSGAEVTLTPTAPPASSK